ncbi:hypothetical protein Rsub_05588 [Raphidocelis subcapitata]|uniref:Uncharacterized protein n=1 Tax=Raphidocelis subcapitata TaxID=307507 RepID=A0A2V0NXN7_9CHLO|nr:hypothetical protein Rsub_05588 [Raphidocelis subcapitata]|eukprot:GBF92386.1 hypothetical protein Rsub_05588 [Raphidocelis subcapitata]
MEGCGDEVGQGLQPWACWRRTRTLMLPQDRGYSFGVGPTPAAATAATAAAALPLLLPARHRVLHGLRQVGRRLARVALHFSPLPIRNRHGHAAPRRQRPVARKRVAAHLAPRPQEVGRPVRLYGQPQAAGRVQRSNVNAERAVGRARLLPAVGQPRQAARALKHAALQSAPAVLLSRLLQRRLPRLLALLQLGRCQRACQAASIAPVCMLPVHQPQVHLVQLAVILCHRLRPHLACCYTLSKRNGCACQLPLVRNGQRPGQVAQVLHGKALRLPPGCACQRAKQLRAANTQLGCCQCCVGEVLRGHGWREWHSSLRQPLRQRCRPQPQLRQRPQAVADVPPVHDRHEPLGGGGGQAQQCRLDVWRRCAPPLLGRCPQRVGQVLRRGGLPLRHQRRQ